MHDTLDTTLARSIFRLEKERGVGRAEGPAGQAVEQRFACAGDAPGEPGSLSLTSG